MESETVSLLFPSFSSPSSSHLPPLPPRPHTASHLLRSSCPLLGSRAWLCPARTRRRPSLRCGQSKSFPHPRCSCDMPSAFRRARQRGPRPPLLRPPACAIASHACRAWAAVRHGREKRRSRRLHPLFVLSVPAGPGRTHLRRGLRAAFFHRACLHYARPFPTSCGHAVHCGHTRLQGPDAARSCVACAARRCTAPALACRPSLPPMPALAANHTHLPLW